MGIDSKRVIIKHQYITVASVLLYCTPCDQHRNNNGRQNSNEMRHIRVYRFSIIIGVFFEQLYNIYILVYTIESQSVS